MIVEDDEALRGTMFDYFTAKGYTIVTTATGENFEAFVSQHLLDLILLDLNLPDICGLTLLRAMRSHSNVPVFVVSGRTDDASILEALDLCADDYVIKPFNIRELELRIRNFLHRRKERPQGANEQWRIGEFLFDIDQRRILNGQNQPVSLTRGEFEILMCLLRAECKVLQSESILETLQANNVVMSLESLPVVISRLRSKLKSDCIGSFIQNLPGQGYRLSSSVRRV